MRIPELEFSHADAFNTLNHPTFYLGDQDILADNFGKIQSTNTSSRKVQFGLRIAF